MIGIDLDKQSEASLTMVVVPLFDSHSNEGLVQPVDVIGKSQVDCLSVS